MNICIIGPESTGKSTLSKTVSHELGLPLVEEYAREYLEERGPEYQPEDLLQIGLVQADRIEMHRSEGQDFISDTDLLVIMIWMEDKFGLPSEELTRRWVDQQADHYLLCKPDIPWEPDRLREDPNRRTYFFKLFERHLKAHGLPYSIVEGVGHRRTQLALNIIRELLN